MSQGFNAIWVNLLTSTFAGGRQDGAHLDGIGPFTSPGRHRHAEPGVLQARRSDDRDRGQKTGWSSSSTRSRRAAGWLCSSATAWPRATPTAPTWAGATATTRTSSGSTETRSTPGRIRVTTPPSLPSPAASRRPIRGISRPSSSSTRLRTPSAAARCPGCPWKSLLGLDVVYTYSSAYRQVLAEYNRKQHLPVVLAETTYEFEPQHGYRDAQTLRRRRTGAS